MATCLLNGQKPLLFPTWLWPKILDNWQHWHQERDKKTAFPVNLEEIWLEILLTSQGPVLDKAILAEFYVHFWSLLHEHDQLV